jgi:CBS domain-containing protein
MQVRDIMTPNPACCTPLTTLQEVAMLMVDNDCGCIPVVESTTSLRPVGVITDRDIVTRKVAQGINPVESAAADCMTSPVIMVRDDASASECLNLMEQHKIRRVPVVNHLGEVVGMVAQADVALRMSEERVGDVVKEVSEPSNGQ